MPQGKCKLCLKIKDLQDSHFMPASLYRATKEHGCSQSKSGSDNCQRDSPTSRQMKDFLLCKDCEDLFNKRGEAYAMSLVNRAGRFPLLEALQKVTPTNA